MKNSLIKRYGTESRFVTWRLETRKGKTTKLPYQLSGKLASSTDPKTWTTFKNVDAKYKNVGIVLHDSLLLAIDLDHVLGEKGDILPEHKELVTKILKASNSFTEISQSGTGLHIFIELIDPLTLVHNKKSPAECYVSGRYIALTGNIYGKARPVRKMTAEEAYRLVEIAIPQTTTNPPQNSNKLVVTTPSLLEGLTDSKILEGMFAASNGAEIKSLYDGNISVYQDDASRADLALLSHLAFWCQKNAQQMESIWLASPLGQRQKTLTRADYRKRSINTALKNCTTVYTPSNKGESETSLDDLNLLYSMKGKQKSYYKNTENMTRVLLRHPEFKDTLRFDEYRSIVERKVKGAWRTLEDHDDVDIQTRISVLFSDFAHVSKLMTRDAIIQASYHNRIDSGADYLRSLVWDKKPRLDDWIPHTYHTAKDEYHRTVGANWVKGMVKRVIHPGCKFDYVLVLEGPQGIRKSTSLMTLAGVLGHVETTVSTEQKDFFMQFLGNAIVEFSEGETLSRTEVKRMKALITIQVDKFRAPYGHTVMPHPRRSVFAMTTNQTEYLKDETGNRRWLPVAVIGAVDIQWLEENREQVLAEAYYRVITEKEKTWEFPEKEMQKQQQMRRIQDANAEPVANWYIQLSQAKRDEGITVDQAFREALHNGFSHPLTKTIEMGIADVLKTVLMLDKQRGMVGGLIATRWYPTDETPKPIEVPTPFISETASLDDENF